MMFFFFFFFFFCFVVFFARKRHKIQYLEPSSRLPAYYLLHTFVSSYLFFFIFFFFFFFALWRHTVHLITFCFGRHVAIMLFFFFFFFARVKDIRYSTLHPVLGYKHIICCTRLYLVIFLLCGATRSTLSLFALGVTWLVIVCFVAPRGLYVSSFVTRSTLSLFALGVTWPLCFLLVRYSTLHHCSINLQ